MGRHRYDCSGSMSYAFHGAGMLDRALDSSGFMSWGEAGKGQWVTIYAKGDHAYMIVAGLRFDTSGRANQGTRWQATMRSCRATRSAIRRGCSPDSVRGGRPRGTNAPWPPAAGSPDSPPQGWWPAAAPKGLTTG